jgi:hypothetical protein
MVALTTRFHYKIITDAVGLLQENTTFDANTLFQIFIGWEKPQDDLFRVLYQ